MKKLLFITLLFISLISNSQIASRLNVMNLPYRPYRAYNVLGVDSTGSIYGSPVANRIFNFSLDSFILPRMFNITGLTDTVRNRYTKTQSDNRYYTKAQADVRYLQSFTEVDPVWLSDKPSYSTKTVSDGLYKTISYQPTLTLSGNTLTAGSKSSPGLVVGLLTLLGVPVNVANGTVINILTIK